jgi:5'-3' exoribonuclease 1
MGIPFYFYVITRAHPGILQNLPPKGAKGLYLDFNGAVYQAVHKLGAANLPVNNATVIKETLVYLDWLVGLVKPSAELGICLDGVAPRAKMVQQRKRRFMGMFRALLENAHKPPSFDTCAISPGTEFMKELATALRDHTPTHAPMHTWVSPADEPGEGEHKIFARWQKQDGPRLIYGLDADLIMLSLLSHERDIYLMREPQSDANDAQSPFLYVNINALRDGILSMVSQKYRWPVSPACDPFSEEARAWIETYIVLCFLLGNDFLPPLPAITLKNEGLDVILRAYGRVLEAMHTPLVDSVTHTLNYSILALVLEDLATGEDARLHEACMMNAERRCHARTPEDRIEFYPSLPENRDPTALAICSQNQKNVPWRLTYYMGLFDTRRADVPRVMRESTHAYLLGMTWVYKYYTRLNKDAAWFYPYGYAPSTKDLAQGLQAEQVVLEKRVSAWHDGPGDGFVDPVVQLLAILPPTSVELLPPHVRAFMTTDAPGCRHFYPPQFGVHTFLKNRLWECHPKLPILDVDWIAARLKKYAAA